VSTETEARNEINAMKRIAILQSNYIPWKGYLDLIAAVDEFILFDDMQFTRRDWRNRNLLKTPQGLQWLSIPVKVKGKYFQKIKDTEISDPDWRPRHWKTIVTHYSKARYFPQHKSLLEELYLGCSERFLSEINYRFLKALCGLLGITTKLSWSMDYSVCEGKTERLVDLCLQTNATEYLSGPAARDYIMPELFEEANITLKYMDYSGYQEYRQLYPPFQHGVSVIDLILNEGPDARKYMKF
jgi:hypothetical protein